MADEKHMPEPIGTNLLTCLRQSGERLRPALSEARRRRPVLEQLVAPFRILAPLSRMPLRLPPQARYFLPSRSSPNSKTAAAMNELLAAGLDRSTIWTPDQQDERVLARIMRTAMWGLRLSPMLIWLAFLRRFDSCDRQILVGRAAMRQLLRRHPHLTPIIISDVNPTLHMLWSAAVSLGRAPLWWQDDYHHTGPLPYPVGAAAVLNQGGYAAALKRSPEALIAMRPRPAVKPMQEVPPKPRVGVATNASFTASPTQIALLAMLRDGVGARHTILRLHPNSPLHGRPLPEAWLAAAPADETLAAFARRVDMAVVGNSAAQLRLLGEGVPVLHVAGLDEHGFDLYGYVRNGFSMGMVRSADVSVDAINRHYADPAIQQRITDFMGLRRPVTIPGLAALARHSGSCIRTS
ncbi:hypothetical protein [Sphingobium sp. B2]|uniref:hypothetical protein n=1 Tax=Sphingobium sp. B2 TaxID=2583228 RepID=UPI0011A978D8|nr:hypothetical protein [Sphingobium sp. B2]